MRRSGCETPKALLEEREILSVHAALEGVAVKSAASNRSSRRRLSRRQVLWRGSTAAAAITAGAAVGFLKSPETALAVTPSPAQDLRIFNFALLLEYLQAAFYTEALRHGGLTGEVRQFAEVVADHERAHVKYLRKALGAHARERPSFDFGDAVSNEKAFLRAAVTLENTGVLAYNGQAANLTKPALAAAAEIVSVEGRHAAWISDLAGQPPAPRAADVGLSAADVVRQLQSTRFLRST
jgi:rubrerythrin